jgi:hypothetical protein
MVACLSELSILVAVWSVPSPEGRPTCGRSPRDFNGSAGESHSIVQSESPKRYCWTFYDAAYSSAGAPETRFITVPTGIDDISSFVLMVVLA